MRAKILVSVLALTALAAPAVAQDVTFTLSNLSASNLTELYASPVGNDNWEENILGGSVLDAGASAEVTIGNAQGCNYDLRMVFSDGDVLEDSSDVCNTAGYTIN